MKKQLSITETLKARAIHLSFKGGLQQQVNCKKLTSCFPFFNINQNIGLE